MLVVDAGGGTVDCCTYRVKKADPLRLEEEVVEPKGLCSGK